MAVERMVRSSQAPDSSTARCATAIRERYYFAAAIDRPFKGECVADDPGGVPAPRPRRRHGSEGEAAPGPRSVDPTDAAKPVYLHADPGFGEGARLPTFVNAPQEATAGGEAGAAPPGGERHALARPVVSPVDQDWLPMLDGRSNDPEICPFLRAADDSGRMVAPIETPDPANRCAALREPVPQSLRQQELVCLASGHVNCPRYLRGAVVIAEAPEAVVRPGRTVSPAVIGSVLILVMAASTSLAFVMARGGLELAAAVPTASPVASQGGVAQASATPAPTTAPTPIPTASPSPTPTASLSPSPSPSATPTPRPTAKPTTKPTPRPTPASDRYAVLRPCPDAPRCWIYRVRAGDNIYSIARWFGISEDSIYTRNPFVRNGLRPGQDLRLPPPTR